MSDLVGVEAKSEGEAAPDQRQAPEEPRLVIRPSEEPRRSEKAKNDKGADQEAGEPRILPGLRGFDRPEAKNNGSQEASPLLSLEAKASCSKDRACASLLFLRFQGFYKVLSFWGLAEPQARSASFEHFER